MGTMKKFLSNSVAVAVLFIILLIIIPLPTFLLDIMLVLNITLSMIILLTTMYIKEALEFSVFPSILLITTLFRLSLNVSSTRLILGNSGDAGKIIKTFGEFVVGGKPVVGFIIFIIIVIVQFIVITKGAERVAEVAARFTLDAMPGKQMAIDADLNAGLITEDEAKIRRENVRREADFYGAMDGASKFVKGDAIISIIIAFINLIGGAIIGMTEGGDLQSVMSTYSLATVGDGLVSQLPALFISVAMGMVVTRAASTGSLNQDLSRQFLSQPKVLMISGGAVIALMLIPGFPKIQLIVIGATLVFLGYKLHTIQVREAFVGGVPSDTDVEEPTSEMEYYKNIDNVYKLLPVEQIEMEFGYSLLHLVDESSGGDFIDRVILFRKQFALDMGMVIPSVRMRDNSQINPNQYVIKIKGEEVARAEILVDHYLALDSGNVEQEIDGIDTIEPAFGIPAKWISEDKKVYAEVAGYTLIDATSVMITHLSEVIKSHAHELLSRQEVKNVIEKIKENNPVIIEDTVPSVVSIGYLQKVLGMLLREGIPIRDMESILETLGDHAGQLKDIDIVTEYVRQSLKRTITRRFSDAGQLRVITLDADVENLIVSAVKKSDQGSYLAMDPETVQKIVTSLTEEMEKVKDVIQTPIVLTSPIVRIYFKKLIDQFVPNVTVLSFSEIDNTVQIQATGNIVI